MCMMSIPCICVAMPHSLHKLTGRKITETFNVLRLGVHQEDIKFLFEGLYIFIERCFTPLSILLKRKLMQAPSLVVKAGRQALTQRQLHAMVCAILLILVETTGHFDGNLSIGTAFAN